ncbi:MAG: DNA-3-methyladenine glycosylase [Bacteroidetes bacterium ADurb.BinA245]|jgi:DNA-3-methyladenine glycosylase II|nr:DNA-3-methyladenine glycosylase 2 family protein [Chitinophagaceae bacterium]OPZ17523.1 MAG: DNA-3-methyladenine glycosylase [Bacteroidetes bacterium ADurb.BinA245]
MHYITHLSKDVVLKKLIDEQETFELEIQKNLCIYLCLSIMSQQLSTKVAAVFKKRFLALYKGKPTAQKIVDTPFETLRAIGLSNAKANYIQNVARFELEQGMSFSKLSKMSDEEVISYLTQIKGVGRWTVEMLLMFALGREDLFAMDDLGLQQAVIGLYGLKHRKKKTMQAAIKKISEQWAPYRTYACLHLWQWKDNTP